MCPIYFYRKFSFVIALRIQLEAISFSVHSFGQDQKMVRSKINDLKNDVK